MNFQISALSEERFRHLYFAENDLLAEVGAKRVMADSNPGYPCRVFLRDAEIGESLLLINHVHHDEPTPYRASHAIYIIEGASNKPLPPNAVPKLLRSRILSVRAFNTGHDMVAAEVCEGRNLEEAITRLASAQDGEYLHIHNAGPGCYAARVDFC